MKSIAILLSDAESISEGILVKSLNLIKKSRIKNFYLIGDKNDFNLIFKKIAKFKKIKFLNISSQNLTPQKYLQKITEAGIKLFNKKKINYLINMPLNKKKNLGKYAGYTEFFSKKLHNKNFNMLLYNENFSVCPLTTHIRLKNVEKNVTRKNLLNCIKNIVSFYNKILKKKFRIIVLGLNPHAGKDMKKTKDQSVLLGVVNSLKKKGMNIVGPVSADTAFNFTKGNVYIGMYHDQVLIPFKLLNKFNGINITIGNKYIRMSPDHGTGINCKKKSVSIQSFVKCIKFCEKY